MIRTSVRRASRLLLVGVAACAALAAATAAAQTLQYGNYLPPSHASNRYALEPLLDKVEQDTDGSLKFRLHPGGSLVNGKETLAAIRDGLVDGGFVVSLYVPNEIPLNTAMSDLALLAGDPLAVMGAVNETVLLDCPQCLEEWGKHNVVYVGTYATTPYNLMCKEPVDSLEDVKGRKTRAPGDVYGRWANAMGAVPVNIENAEAYEALERGQLDCVIGSPAWLKTLSLWDVVTNVVDLPMGAYFGGALISFNQTSWDSVKEADKAAFMKHVPWALAQLAVGYVKDDQAVLKEAQAKGVEITEPPAKLESLLNNYQESEVQRAVDKAKERGAQDPEPVIRAFLENLEKWRGLTADMGLDAAKFEKALREEIYNKVEL